RSAMEGVSFDYPGARGVQYAVANFGSGIRENSDPQRIVHPIQRFVMRSVLLRNILILLAILVGIGFWRGWWSFSSGRDAGDNKLHIQVTVDPAKVHEDMNRA